MRWTSVSLVEEDGRCCGLLWLAVACTCPSPHEVHRAEAWQYTGTQTEPCSSAHLRLRLRVVTLGTIRVVGYDGVAERSSDDLARRGIRRHLQYRYQGTKCSRWVGVGAALAFAFDGTSSVAWGVAQAG